MSIFIRPFGPGVPQAQFRAHNFSWLHFPGADGKTPLDTLGLVMENVFCSCLAQVPKVPILTDERCCSKSCLLCIVLN